MNSEKIRSIVLCAMFAALVAVGAFIKIPIPLIPLTLQVTFTTLAGYLLGAKNGMISVLIYIFAGLIGLPVFTGGGGPAYVLSPTFGYIIGFAFGAYLTGKIAYKKENPTYSRLLVAGLSGLGVVYAFGLIYYYIITRFYLNLDTSVKQIFIYCFLAVIPGDLILTFISALIAKRLIPIVSKKKNNI